MLGSDGWMMDGLDGMTGLLLMTGQKSMRLDAL
jgi:hypothetical protein